MSSVAAPPTYPRQRVRWALSVLLLGNVVVHTTMFLTKPVVSYRVIALAGDENDIGLVVAAGALLPVFLAIPMGRLCDRGHTTPVLLGGLAVIAGSPLWLAHTDTIAGMAWVNAGYGTGLLAVMVGSQALVAGLSGVPQRDRNFGWFTAAASLGQMLGPLTAGWVMTASSPQWLLLATTYALYTAAAVAALALLLFAGLLFGLRRTDVLAPSSPAGGRAGRGSVLRLLADPGLAVAMLVSVAFIAANDLLIAYLPLLGVENGISPGLIGALLGIRAGCSFLSRVFIGVLMARVGRVLVILVSSALAAAAMLGLVAVADPVWLVLLMVLLGLTLGLGQPLTMTWVVQQAPERLRATALALRTTGNRVAQTAAPAAAGALSTAAGIAAPFVLSAVLLGVAAVSVVPFLHARKYLAD
jgi:MFS family permease